MDSEFDTTGVITKISDDFCIVSVTIDNVQKSFSFSKFLFYVFGLQCDGQMTNIVDEGTDVEVRYRFSVEKIPCIVAVWFGEKPNHLLQDCVKLKALYDQNGHVINITEANFVVQNDKFNHTVLISQEVILRDGYRIKNSSGLLVDEALIFDAIPFETEHPSGALYQATCAWVGEKPRLCERFGLHSLLLLDDPWDDENVTGIVQGIVAVIPNEIIAFAETDCESVQDNGKVMLLRKSFATGCDSIKDIVNVGDKLCMQVRYECLFNGRKQCFAVRAWMDGREVDDVRVGEAKSVEETMPPEEYWHLGEEMVPHAEDRISVQGTVPSEEERILVQGTVPSEEDRISVQGTVPSEEDRISVQGTVPSEENRVSVQGTVPSPLEEVASSVVYSARVAKDCVGVRSEGLDYANRTTEVRGPSVGVRKRTRTRPTRRRLPEKANDGPMKTGSGVAKESSEVSSETKTGESDAKFDVESEVLLNTPPLSGVITIISQNSAWILFAGLKIFVDRKAFFHNGNPCAQAQFVLLLTTKIQVVNFEAVKSNDVEMKKLGFSHQATCVWVGRKPSLMSMKVDNTPPKTPEPANASRKSKTNVKTFSIYSHVLYSDPPLSGIAVLVNDYSGFISYKKLMIYFTNEEFYYYGQLCKKSEFGQCLSGNLQTVCFEAVKTSNHFRIGCRFFHEATCVWLGNKPTLAAVTKTFPPPKFSLLLQENRTFLGVVRKFCLPKVALVVIENETTVILHISGLDCSPKKGEDFVSGKWWISQFVKLGDTVEFKVTRISSFFNQLCATEAKVVKEEVPGGSDSGLPKDTSQTQGASSAFPLSRKDVRKDGSTRGVSQSHVFHEKSTPHQGGSPFHTTASSHGEQHKSSKSSHGFSPEDVTTPVKTVPEIAAPVTLSSQNVTQKECISCPGTANVDTISKVVHLQGTRFSKDDTDSTNLAPLVSDDMLTNEETSTGMLEEMNNFDIHSPPIYFTPDMVSEFPLEKLYHSLPSECRRGKIVSIPLPDCAIAESMRRFRVLIPVDCFYPEDARKFPTSFDGHLTVGDYVYMEFEFSRNCYTTFKAECCWKDVIQEDMYDERFEKAIDGEMSWSDMWELGELFKTEELKKEEGHHAVTFKSSKLLRDITVHIQQEGFFFNGKSAYPPNYLYGQKVTFHVAHKSLSTPILSHFIPYAWIGNMPEAVNILVDRLTVPKGVVFEGWSYKGIVEDFPLPTHAICRIGAVPVAVCIGEISSGVFVKTVSVDLVKGTPIEMRLCEQNVGRDVCLVSTKTSPVKISENIILTLKGFVSSLPRPVGKIIAKTDEGNIEVSFDLVSVKIPEDMGLTKDDIFNWFEQLKNDILITTPVCLTVVKNPQVVQWRALQVWVDKSSLPKNAAGEKKGASRREGCSVS